MSHQIRWTSNKIRQRLETIQPLVHRRRAPLPLFRYLVLPDASTIPADIEQRPASDWSLIEPYTYWAKPKTNFILQTEIQLPADWGADEPVALSLPLGEAGSFSHPEALLYLDGKPFAATDRHHHEVQLPESVFDGMMHTLTLHGWSGNVNRDGEHGRVLMRPCELVQICPCTRAFTTLARTALEVADHQDANSVVKGKLLTALDAAFIALDTREPIGDAFYNSVAQATGILQQGIDDAGPAMDVSISAAGHAHIDLAWLWTLAQTRRKTERTFHTVLHLMEQFPEYKFTQSQPYLYEVVQQDQPELFERIKAHIEEGRWEPTGGMWVEADCNLSGPEALARQFLLGRHYFRTHFGADADSPILWLPDVFGYAWALPQLIKQAGLEYFMTIKITWNQYNRLPYDSFWWQGLDGTRVLTHFSPTPEDGIGTKSTYNAFARPQDAIDTWNNFLQKDEQDHLMMVYGYGDGGGGPTREMLETIRDLRDFPGAPKVKHDTAGEFFRRMERESGDKLPTWNGELYLEYHRGTYTTQAKNKLANRRSEFALHDAEFFGSLALLLDQNFAYPTQAITDAWKIVCLHQFHDILPGSSIHEVYEDSALNYAEAFRLIGEARDAALKSIRAQILGDMLVLNATSFSRSEPVLWDDVLPAERHLVDSNGRAVQTQRVDEGTLIEVDQLPPYSVTGLQIVTGLVDDSSTSLTADAHFLENALIRVELSPEGDIARVYDKRVQRELIPEGMVANQWQAFEDRPMDWDAWDIDIFYDDKMWLSEPATRVELVEAGPLRATIEIERRVLNSPYVQRISLCHDSAEIRIHTRIDWRDRHILLKTAFPVNILAPSATYDIQWGNVERPTHRNTSWDWARFETAAQKWVDLSEHDFGASLLNDCKYGHDVRDNVMRLTLLRAPTYPDPTADLGEHEFTYSLLPHPHDWRTATIPAAYALNDPLQVVSGQAGELTTTSSFVTVDSPHVVIETVKRAEDGRGFIVRLYECHRSRKPVTLTTGFDIDSATVTNLIEDDTTPLACEQRSIKLMLNPYEIMTLRVIPAR